MKKLFTRGRIAAMIVTVILLIDQAIKVWVKTHMYKGESIRIADWFYIHFTENPGMAFGMEIFDKLFLTSFRIVAAILPLVNSFFIFSFGLRAYKLQATGFRLHCNLLPVACNLSLITDLLFHLLSLNAQCCVRNGA